MPLSPEDLEQIRSIVRTELAQTSNRRLFYYGLITPLSMILVFVGVLALHVIVIGGFTVYHLLHQ